jgi:hypothetical protein
MGEATRAPNGNSFFTIADHENEVNSMIELPLPVERHLPAAAPLQARPRRRRFFSPRLGRPCAQSFAQRASIILLLASAFTAFVLCYSLQHGRLTLFLTYDDVGYLRDAAARLDTFYREGIGEVLQQYRHHPPHAPWSTGLAALAFAIGGLHDWVPYAANVVLIIIYFAFADFLLKGVALWQKVFCFAILASTPLLAWAVSEFRADHAAALFLTISLILIIRRPWVSASRGYQMLAGAFGGFSIAAKPHTFVAATCLTGAALTLALACDWLGERRRLTVDHVRSALLACLAPFVLIPFPHFLVGWKGIWGYMYDNVLGRYRDVWQTQGTLAFHLQYYLWGEGGQTMLGGTTSASDPPRVLPFHLLLIAIVLGLALLRLIVRFRRRELIRGMAVALLVLCAYLIPSLMKNKTPFFGLEFHTLLLFVMVMALRGPLLGERLGRARWRRFVPVPIAAIAMICLTVAAIAHPGLPTIHGDKADVSIADRRAVTERIWTDLRQNTDFASPMVFVTSPGDLDVAWLQCMAIEAGVQLRSEALPFLIDDPSHDLKKFDKANFVVASDANSGLIADFLPNAKMQDQLVTELAARIDYRQVGRYIYAPTGRGYYLFERVGAFFGWRPGDGFGPMEGPIWSEKLPLVRWGYGPSSTCLLTSQEPGTYVLSFWTRNGFADQMMSIALDGKRLTQFPLPAYDGFQCVRITFDAPRGEHALTFGYSKWSQQPQRPLAVLFSGLQVLKAR